MGAALASRLLAAGHHLSVYNRTRAKAEPLAEQGATIVDSPSDLSDCDVVFTILAGNDDFKQVVLGGRLLSPPSGRAAISWTRRRSLRTPRLRSARSAEPAAPRCWPRRSAATRRWPPRAA